MTSVSQGMVKRMKASLKVARNDALEEAAEIVDLQSMSPHWGNQIRGIKTKETPDDD